jgi:F-type H+-transporting ATPase subunit b
MIEFGAEFWVAVAFLLFIGVILFKKVPGMVTGMLDEKAALIKKQLDEARSLRTEAEALLAQSQKEQKDAIRQVKEITTLAAEEAEIHAGETRASLSATIDRRSRMAQEKIAQGQAQAVKEVRDVVINVATEAARELIAEALKTTQKTAIVNDSISNLDNRIH